MRAVYDAKKIKGNTTVAIYHLSVKTISRSAGRSATAAAAYRSGVEITDLRTGEVHDYTRKGGVESADLVLPVGAPEWASNRAELWNAAEQAETRKNSTVAREFEIALPSELSPDERKRLAIDFAREIVERHGCAADVSIHAPGKEGDNRNHHAHILCSTRRLMSEGFGEKTRELDERKTGQVEHWRERFAGMQNERLRDAGVEARVDHRTLKAQGIDREPTRHLGPAAIGYERRTREPSNKRLDFEAEVAERLTRAKEAGQLAREHADVICSIIDLSADISAAKSEQERQRRAANPGSRSDGLWGRLETQMRPTERPAQHDSDIEAAIKSYGAWATPKPPQREMEAPHDQINVANKPLPEMPKAAHDWSQFRSFAGAKAEPLPTQPEGDKAVYPPPSGPGYFPETIEERQRNEEAAAGGRLLREQDSTRTDELWERMERERQEQERRERDSGPDMPGF
ncbi:MobQ family relaxase [Janthinobacterium sp. GB1R12]|uniref:MobQ family relaxase n=1 Tax=Janthinobacterium sp. GB1R12 TaxID=3424190 RepID=UPI003F21F1B1